MLRRKEMRKSFKTAALAVAVCVALSIVAWSQGRGGGSITVNPDGSVTIKDAKVPLPGILSEGAKKVLMRTRPTEGPGAPVPTPSIGDMAELRRVYNENLKPNVEHMREVFPVDIEETTMDGISVAVVTPKGGVPAKNKNRAFINAPGGGYRTGVRANGLLISIPVAATLGVKVVSIIYRQGPEYRFPAGEEDLLKVWNVMAKTYKPANMGMVGCSAGGGLIAHATAMLLLKGQPGPGVLGSYCSGLGNGIQGDGSFTSSVSITNIAADAAASANPAPAAGGGASGPTYWDGVDTKQPAVDPVRDASLMAKWPPTIFLTGTRDFALSNALYSHRILAKAGKDTRLLVYDGLYHGFMTNPDFPESREAYEICSAFFDKHLGK
jgi:monoterpene epsilon-lactone hydrolase